MAGSTRALPAEEADARAAVVKAGRAFAAAPAYRAAMKEYRPDGSVGPETITEYQAPDRLRIVTATRETVVHGDESWVRLEKGAWRAKGPSSLVAQLRTGAQRADALVTGKTGFALLRRERVGDTWTRVYRYHSKPGARPASTTTLWVAESDGLPRQEEFVLDQGQGAKVRRMTTFQYDADIRIEKPVR
jgi:hypothetical protein